ncbi:MAG: hypothetical protein K9J37_02025 [Saprospiraceae bacterium]|nr:hypothetical protein [Saprospiraceae bacterium]MCF8248656.1 hypothetical protein [Saprospiraceae bacterium]MCF8278854.1 hypothetical protein [Bacteroidales bacterium]MCF8310654.1 hypothetical protein [Saprospiraceae bacterium]MCF8439213.1 hypothetical protein [Saprospiraceae bacterium]
MAQQLIVEGSDAIVVSEICIKRKLPPPKGYSDKQEFIDKFAKSAGSYNQAVTAFKNALEDPALNRIGIILDADEQGAAHRWGTLKNILHEQFPDFDLSPYSPTANGIVIEILPSLTIGIWVMPDNISTGYLEHFIAKLAPQADKLWLHANETVENLHKTDFCKFSLIRKQKALVHTWLAWQKEPGRPIGAAIQAGYFDAKALAADSFVDWMGRVFELEN